MKTFKTEKRIHMGLTTRHFDESLAFYRTLFAAEPVKLKPGYAKFELEEPPVNFTLTRRDGEGPALSHLGIQVKSREAVTAQERPMNILSNKMSALQRNLAKDVMDVVFICLNYDFDWVEIFEDVERKDAWTHELWVVNHLNKFDFSNLETAHLTKPMDVPLLRQHCIAIAIDIIKGERNSLHKPK